MVWDRSDTGTGTELKKYEEYCLNEDKTEGKIGGSETFPYMVYYNEFLI